MRQVIQDVGSGDREGGWLLCWVVSVCLVAKVTSEERFEGREDVWGNSFQAEDHPVQMHYGMKVSVFPEEQGGQEGWTERN